MDEIEIEDFIKINLRVAKVESAERQVPRVQL